MMLPQAEQQAFTNRVQQAVTRFVHHQKDTLDVAAFTSFAWDSVYAFGGYTGGTETQEGWPWIDWSRIWADGGMVPDDVLRLVFVRGHTAVGYLELRTRLVHAVHYRQYFADERGYFHSYIHLPSGGYREPGNALARADARFVLVGPAHLPHGDTTQYVFAPASFFRGKEAQLQQAVEYLGLELHPLRGCGHANCWANTH
jgi:hypothetical protein